MNVSKAKQLLHKWVDSLPENLDEYSDQGKLDTFRHVSLTIDEWFQLAEALEMDIDKTDMEF